MSHDSPAIAGFAKKSMRHGAKARVGHFGGSEHELCGFGLEQPASPLDPACRYASMKRAMSDAVLAMLPAGAVTTNS